MKICLLRAACVVKSKILGKGESLADVFENPNSAVINALNNKNKRFV